MASLDMRPSRRNALAAGVTETAGGALLALGLATPLARVSLIGTMITAIRKVNVLCKFYQTGDHAQGLLPPQHRRTCFNRLKQWRGIATRYDCDDERVPPRRRHPGSHRHPPPRPQLTDTLWTRCSRGCGGRGLALDVEQSELPDLPAAEQLAVYRTVQEAMINVLKHAPDAASSVRITCDDAAVQVHMTHCRRNGIGHRGSGRIRRARPLPVDVDPDRNDVRKLAGASSASCWPMTNV